MPEYLHETELNETSPALPCRRPVPWNGVDVALIFLLWISLTIVCCRFAVSQVEMRAGQVNGRKPTPVHPLTQLIERGREQPVVLVVAFFSGVMLAPLAEEFLFRLLLQGWVRKRAVFSLDDQRVGMLPGVVSIFVVSVIFAAIHGGQRTEQNIDTLFYSMIGLAVANLFTVGLGMTYLIWIVGADRSDLGVPPGGGISDVLTGIATFGLCGPAILALNILLRYQFPEAATDPIPLFFFSVVLGILFYRTGRLLPCVTMHACLNGFSFVVLAFGKNIS